jgi:polar amino acid transport system substrate-binding protein
MTQLQHLTRRRSRSVILVLAVAATSLVASAQTSPLRLVSTAWPPFTDEPGRPRFAQDLVEAGLGRVGLTANTTIVEPARFTLSLINGPFDGSAAAWRDPARERALIFSRPYLENRLILVGRHGADVSAKTMAALKGKRVAIVQGYSYGSDIDNAGPTFVRSNSEEDSLRILLNSGVDYTLMDEIVVQYIVDHYANEARTRLQLGSSPLVTRPLYMAIRRSRPDAQSIVDRFNAQLRAMIADRTYHRLLHVEWIQADVDGDGSLEYIPQGDKEGPVEPERAYTLFSTSEATSTGAKKAEPPATKPPQKRYYFGGTIYTDWASVPDMYKVHDNNRPPDPARSTASIFTFNW